MTGPAIELLDVEPRFEGPVASAPLTLRVESGTFMTVVTSPTQAAALFRTLLALQPPAAGTVRVLGEDPHALRRRPLRQLRRRVGSCLLPDGLIANTTLRSNVALPLVFGDGWSNEEAEARADEVLAHFSLGRWAARRPSDLAPDTRQIASLARAVAARPELLMLHDPLTSVSSADAVHLLTLCQEYATTIFAAVHGEDEAVCMMADGSVLWDERGQRTLARA